MNYLHLGACVGNWSDGTKETRCGFTEFIKKNYMHGDKIFLVEANPKNIDKLKKFYENFDNVEIINLGISEHKNKILPFFYTEEDAPHYMVCSTKIEHVKKHYPKAEIKQFQIKTTTIVNLLKNFIKTKSIDFLSIDLEGNDFQTIMSLPIKEYDIKNISIEHLHLKKFEKRLMVNHLIKNGYSYCGFGYDHQNFDFLFKKKKIFLNIIISKFLWLISKKHLKYLNYFISK